MTATAALPAVSGRARLGALLLAAMLLMALWPNAWLPHDPLAMDLLHRLEPPSARHWLGTDGLGRSVLSRVVAGAQVSLAAALAASAATCALALLVGLSAALGGRWVDEALMRCADVLMGFPTLVLALAVVGVLGASLPAVLAALVLAWTPGLARVVRTLAQQAAQKDYVHAARQAGLSEWQLIQRHVLPQMLPPLAVLASLETAGFLLALSALSFLGLGAQPPTPEWGVMLNEARPHLQSAPHLLLGPGLAVLLTTLGFNLLGEGLRDRLDTRVPFRW